VCTKRPSSGSGVTRVGGCFSAFILGVALVEEGLLGGSDVLTFISFRKWIKGVQQVVIEKVSTNDRNLLTYYLLTYILHGAESFLKI